MAYYFVLSLKHEKEIKVTYNSFNYGQINGIARQPNITISKNK